MEKVTVSYIPQISTVYSGSLSVSQDCHSYVEVLTWKAIGAPVFWIESDMGFLTPVVMKRFIESQSLFRRNMLLPSAELKKELSMKPPWSSYMSQEAELLRKWQLESRQDKVCCRGKWFKWQCFGLVSWRWLVRVSTHLLSWFPQYNQTNGGVESVTRSCRFFPHTLQFTVH